MDDGEHHGRSHHHHGRGELEALHDRSEPHPRREKPVPRRVLERVRDLVCRDRDRCDRAAVMVRWRQPHDVCNRVVVVGWRDLDGNVLQPGQVEQMAGEFTSGRGQIWPLSGVLLHRAAHPPLGAEDETEQEGSAERQKDGHVRYVAVRPYP